MTNKMSEYKTLTGLTIAEALSLLMKILPPEAYTSVPGASGFTDIDPAWLTKIATDAFGACGIGWFYEYYPENISIEKNAKESSKGRKYTEYDVLINRMEVVYAYLDENGELKYSSPIISNGGSCNEDRSYALRGAITNAIGSAFAKLEWQIKVYMGYINHTNAKNAYDLQEGKVAKKTSTAPAAAQTATTTAQAQVVTVAASVEQPKPADQEKTKEVNMSLVVPEGAGTPLDGQPLSSVVQNKLFGEAVLKFLTGDYPNAAGHKYDTTEHKDIQEAVVEILKSGNYEKPTKSKA